MHLNQETYEQLLTVLNLTVSPQPSAHAGQNLTTFVCKSFYERLMKGETITKPVTAYFTTTANSLEHLKSEIQNWLKSLSFYSVTAWDALSPAVQGALTPKMSVISKTVLHSYEETVRVRLFTGVPQDRARLVLEYLHWLGPYEVVNHPPQDYVDALSRGSRYPQRIYY